MKTWWSERTFTETKTAPKTPTLHRVAERPLRGLSVVILGGGPGLDPKAAHTLSQARSIGVNNSYLFYTAPAIIVALDRRWWQWHGNNIRSAGHVGITSLQPKQPAPQGFSGFSFHKDREGAFNPCTGTLCGMNSGHAAICLAMHMGAERVYLAGFDMGFSGNRSHWHSGHSVPSSQANYAKRFRPALENLVRAAARLSVEVSAITPSMAAIPHTPMEKALEDLFQ